MTENLKYNTSINGVSFSLFELEQALILKMKGFTIKEIRQEIIEKNLFQHQSVATIKRMLPTIMRRANAMDEEISQLFLEGTIDVKKVLNLYAIMKTDRLFNEFMNEVIHNKFVEGHLFLEVRDINIFFTEKAEQHEMIANWAEGTVKKLKSIFQQVLVDSGLLKSRKSGDLTPLLVDDLIREHLIRIGDEKYIYAMGDDGGI